jgi:hypothetical protein
MPNGAAARSGRRSTRWRRAAMCGCSRSKAWRALRTLEPGSEKHRGGWIACEWRGGKQTNIYTPGKRLARIIQRSSPAWILDGMKRRNRKG